jgi:hypothetical protein
MSGKNFAIMMFILGIAVGIIAWNIVMLALPAQAYADATSGTSDGIIAVSGLVTNGISGLWVLDARDTKSSPSLCLYVPESSGRTFKLASVRRIKYDLQLVSYNDTTDKKMSPSSLKDQIEKLNQEAEKNSGNKPK